jgi:sarcosine oxidase gamma subunit
VTVSVWRSFAHWLIGLMITGKGEMGLTGATGGTAALA